MIEHVVIAEKYDSSSTERNGEYQIRFLRSNENIAIMSKAKVHNSNDIYIFI